MCVQDDEEWEEMDEETMTQLEEVKRSMRKNEKRWMKRQLEEVKRSMRKNERE